MTRLRVVRKVAGQGDLDILKVEDFNSPVTLDINKIIDDGEVKLVQTIVLKPESENGMVDRFGIPFFHESKANGFFYEMSDNPKNDQAMDVLDEHYTVSTETGTGATVITMNSDGATSLGIGRHVREDEDSIGGCDQKFNEVEQLGHTYKPDDVRDLEYKCIMKVKDLEEHGFSMSSTTGKHTNPKPCCQGNAYMFNIEDTNASPVTFRFRKEMWHVKYHNSPEGIWTHPAAPTKLDRADWFGFGFCRYNTPAKEGHVTLEAWFCPPGQDFTKKENWVLLKQIEDFTGHGWGNTGGECGGAPDQALTWSGRQNRLKTNAEDGTIDFKCISFREIDPSLDQFSISGSGSEFDRTNRISD
jgi:hypothetical protein